MPANQKTTVYLDPADYDRLKALARREGRAPAELVREAVREYTERHARPRKLKSLGAGRSGTGDLSERADDIAEGAFLVEWGEEADLSRARDLSARHRDLQLGLVDGIVIAVAERRRARAIATLDLRHFASVQIEGSRRLYPRDL